MLRAVMLGVGILVGTFGLLPAEGPNTLLPRAEAGARATARRILRHKKHVLLRRERHNKRQLHREQRQVKHLKRQLHHLRR